MKDLVRESMQMLTFSLRNKFDMKKNREFLMRTLDVVDGNADELRKKMDLALKQLAVIEEKIDALGKEMVRQAEQMSRSFAELEELYGQNISEKIFGSSVSGYRKVSCDAAFLRLPTHSYLDSRYVTDLDYASCARVSPGLRFPQRHGSNSVSREAEGNCPGLQRK